MKGRSTVARLINKSPLKNTAREAQRSTLQSFYRVQHAATWLGTVAKRSVAMLSRKIMKEGVTGARRCHEKRDGGVRCKRRCVC